MRQTVTRVQSDSRELNQAQDNIHRAIKPLLEQSVLMPKETVLSTSRPAASAENHTGFARVKDPAGAESLQVCLQKADGTYAWVTIATAP
jgi:hypothetical protein